MDHAKVMAVFGECERLVLEKRGDGDLVGTHGDYAVRSEQADHLLDMIRRAREMGPERLEKKMRWLGFIQGVLWIWGVSLDALKGMNRSKCSMCRGTGRTGCDRDGNECMSSSCTRCSACGGAGVESLAEEPRNHEFYDDYVARCGTTPDGKYALPKGWRPEVSVWSAERGCWVR